MIYIRKNRDAIDYINEAADDAIIFHDLDDAIVGTNQHGELVYSYDKMHEVFMQDHGMTAEEAEEWIDFNVVGTMAGRGFQVLYT
jgi:hypothetical protein